MKKILFIIIVLFTMPFIRCNNKKDITDTKQESIVSIGNKKNNHLINIPKLNYTNGKANYVFNGLYYEIHKADIDELDYKGIYAVTNIEREKLGNTGFSFKLEDEPNVFYSFPLNYTFNTDYFNREIYDKMGGVLKIKIYVSIYKRDSISDLKTIIIDSVKLR